MTSDPSKLMDSEGEEMSLNKVDKALQSVGITIQDTNHQFRAFDEVITELADKWSTIDTNTQRYIATVMAGNRQQSRFLALVSNGERLAELSEKAANAEDAATLQVLKTMDSIDAKTQQLKTSLQSLYVSSGVQNFFKGILDFGNNIITTFTKMPTTFNLPILALTKFGTQFYSLATIVTTVFSIIKSRLSMTAEAIKDDMKRNATDSANIRIDSEQSTANSIIAIWETLPLRFAAVQADINNEAEKAQAIRAQIAEREATINNNRNNSVIRGGTQAKWGLGLNIAGAAISMLSANMGTATQEARTLKGSLEGVSSVLQGIGAYTMLGGGPLGLVISALTIIPGLVNAISTAVETAEEKTERLTNAATEAKNAYIQQRSSIKTLQEQVDKLKELEAAQYDSEEARQAFIDASNEMAEQHPELISAIDTEGNAIIDLEKSYLQLADAREKAIEAAKESSEESYEVAKNAEENARNNYREKANIEIANFNNRVIEQNQKSYEEELRERLNFGENYDYASLLQYITQSINLEGQVNQDNLIAYLSGQGKNIDESMRQFIISIGEEIKKQFGAIDPSTTLKMSDYLADAVKDSDLLTRIVSAMSSDNAATELYKIFNEENFYDDLQNLKSEEDEYINSLIDFVSDLYKELLPEESKIIQAEKRTEAEQRSGIATIVGQTIYRNSNSWLKELPKASEILTSMVQNQQGEEEYSTFINKVEDLTKETNEALENYWNSLGPSKRTKLIQLLQNAKHYSESSMTTALSEIIEGQEAFSTAIVEELYATAYTFETFKESIGGEGSNDKLNTTMNDFLSVHEDFFETIGGDDLIAIREVYDNLNSQIEKHTITETTANDILNSYLQLWTATEEFDGSAKIAAQTLLSGWSDFSLQGILTLSESLKNSGLSDEQIQKLQPVIEQIRSIIPINLNTELQTFITTATTNMSDFEKAISNMSKGMDFKTASELAAKIGKTVSDFEFRDGKYFFSDFSAARDAYLGDNKAYIDKLTTEIQNEQAKLSDLDRILITGSIEEENGTELIEFPISDLLQGTIEEVKEKLTQYEDSLTEEGYDISSLLSAYAVFYNDTEKTTEDFIKYTSEKLSIDFQKTVGAVTTYTQDLLARSALSNGDIDSFLDTVLGPVSTSMNSGEYQAAKYSGASSSVQREALKQAILSGNYEIEDLPEELRSWAVAIKNSFNEVAKNVYDNAINSITKGEQIVPVNDLNKSLLESLDFVTISEDGKTAFINAAKDDIETIRNGILNASLPTEEADSLLSSLHKIEFKDNIYSALSGVVDKFDSFSYEAGQALAAALGGDDIDALIKQGNVNEDVAGNLSISYTQMLDYLNQNILELGVKQYNDLRAKLEASNDKQRNEVIFKDIIKNRDSLSAANVSSLATMLKIPYDTVLKLLKDNGNGTYSIDLTRIQTLINQGKVTVTDEIKELMADEIDKVISSITGVAGSQSKGYTNLADMQKYVNELSKVTGVDYDFKDLFEYSDVLHAYQLSTKGLIAQIRGMKNQLSTLSGEEKEIAEQLIGDTTRQLAELIDISGYLSLADNDPAKAIKEEQVRQSILDYNAAIAGLGEGTLLATNQIMNSLKEGGLKAVEAARTVAEAAGKTLTAEEVEAAYRSEASQLTDAFEQLVYEPGVIIDNTAAEILRQAGYGIQEIEGTGQSLITSVGKLNRAYKGYLRKLQRTGEATLVDLNEATAMVLETNKGEENDAISALSKAADMTYAEFAEIFTKAGIELTKTMVTQLDNANIIKRIGGGKMQILNWNAFADLMGWTDLDSEEYVSAFKTYNDALIEMNRKAERNIVEEIQSIGDAKAGDVINLTQYSSDLDEETRAALEEKLKEFNATLVDGLLVLDDGANIPAIIQAIINEAGQSGRLLQDHMVELADTLNEVLENYANLIGNGIEGKLTNAQALDLQQQAMGMGAIDQLNELDFVKTADGLKLSSDSAAKLYNNLKNVDSIRSNLVLDKLYSSITTTDERLKSMSGTMNRISEIQKQIAKNERDINGLINVGADENKVKAIQKENEKLEEQLQLYKDIRLEQINDPDSYAFMDRTLPEQFQGAENYYNSVGKAFKAINEAGESGYMEIADFYNFINEASELAELSGKSIDLWGMKIDGSAENAAALIEKGFSALSNVDGEGVKIDLERLGVNFKNGADGMANGFTDGIKAMAKSQIELIDAEIAMLETFVGLQALNDLDTNNNGTIELYEDGLLETVDGIERWSKKYTDTMDRIKKYFTESDDKDIQNALNNITINGYSLNQLLDASVEEIKNAGLSLEDWIGLIDKINKLVNSKDFDPENLIDSINEIISGVGLEDLNITYSAPGVDSITLVDTGNKFGIDFDSAASEAAKKFLDEHGLGGDNTSLTEAFKKYEAGTATPVELTATMIAKGVVKTTDNGIDIVKDDGSVQHFSSENDPGYIEALHKAASVNALEELGVDGKIKYDGGTHEATSTYKIGKKTVNVSSKDGKISYHSDMTGQDYDTPEALRDAEYAHELDRFYKGYRDNPGTKEEFEAVEYGFKLDIKANVQSDIINEPELREKAKKIANMPIEEVENIIKDQVDPTKSHKVNADGTIDVDVEGVQMTIQNKGSLTDKAEAIKGEVLGAIDPDGWITKISVAITDAFKTLNMAQLLIDGLTESLNVQQNNETGEISFTENPTITALGENLGKGMAAGIASAASTGIKTYFDTEGNQVAITEPLKTGVKNAAESTEVTDADYTIPSATATLTKMTIDQVDEVGFSAPSLGDLVKALVGGTKTSDLTLDSATAAVKKLSLVSVDETDLQTQLTAEVEAKIEPIDVSSITTANDAITQTITAVSASLNTLKESIGNLDTNSVSANTSATALNTTLTNISSSTGPARAEDFKNYLNDITPDGPNRAFSFKEAVNALASYGPSYAADFVRSVNALQPKTVQLHGHLSLDAHVNTDGAVSVSAQAGPINASFAKGNANTKNRNPKGSNKTLVGELGPELVVSNGRYYVVGQNGAEMIDLPNDAIIFNHIQTKKLLGSGKGGRGTPITTEKNAVSYATGNVSGPAMVSAQAAIASLKQLRAMWESMLNATAQQLGSQAGKSANKSSGKDSSGNNKSDTVTAEDGTRIKTTTAEIQRWYNLLRQIDKTEKDITYQEKLQTQYQSLRVADGKSLYKSYKAELAMLDDQVARSQELADLQKSWYDTKRAELAASAYGKIFRYTEDGLQQYVDGANKGLDILEKLTEADIWGNPTGYATSAETQLSYIQSLGFDLNDLLSNSDGTKVGSYIGGTNYIVDENGERLEGQDLINAQVSIMENFWDNIDGWRDELDGLYDSYREQLSNVLDNQNKQNEIMQKIVDNQIEVENKVYQALVDARQAIIDNAQKELDAYQKNSEDMIASLNKSLEKERQLYNNQQNSNELLKLQRQLAILQRSGGSTAQILNLQNQIATKQQDMYFDEKEQQIQALQEASDLQIEKMEEQIALMTETLEYEKENGLLWKQVYDVMQRSPEEIIGFIAENSADWASNSALQISQNIADLQTKIQVYVSSRDDNFLSYYNDISSNIHDIAEAVSTYRNEALNYNNEVSSSNAEPASRPIVTSVPTYTSSSSSSSGSNSNNSYKPTSYDIPNDYNGTATLNEGSTTTYKMGSKGYFKGTSKSIGHRGDEVTIIEENAGSLKDGRQVSLVEYKGKQYYIRNERLAYKNGGLIDFTGPAWVDGTPSQPEAILSAKETKFVQNNLPNFLSNIDTLQERLIDMQDLQASWLSSISRIIDANNAQTEGVNIEHVELIMNVEQMSNSADAKKLGKEVLDELLSLSRKSGKNSVSRR